MVQSGDRGLSNELSNLPALIPPNRSRKFRDSIPAKITGGPSGGVYTADLYANGYSQPATKTGVEVEVLNLNASETLPTGTEIIATKSKETYTASG